LPGWFAAVTLSVIITLSVVTAGDSNRQSNSWEPNRRLSDERQLFHFLASQKPRKNSCLRKTTTDVKRSSAPASSTGHEGHRHTKEMKTAYGTEGRS